MKQRLMELPLTSIRKRIVYVGFVTLSLCVLFIVAVGIYFQSINESFKIMNVAIEGSRGTFELTILTQDVISRKSERATEQWQSKLNSIKYTYRSIDPPNEQIAQLKQDILSQCKDMEMGFEVLLQQIQNDEENRDPDLAVIQQKGLQLLNTAHKTINWSKQLSTLAENQMYNKRLQLISMITILVILLLIIITYLISSSVNSINRGMSDVSRRIYALREGKRLEELKEVTKDEFDEITSEFIEMSRQVEFQYNTLVQELATSKRNAEQSNEAKLNFLANVSHEVKTPLGIIMGFSEVIRSGNNLNPQMSSYLERIIENAKILDRLINNLLDHSKIEAQKINLEITEFQIRDFLKNICSQFEHIASEKKLKLNLKISENTPQLLTSDSTRLRQIIYNLLSNALKFTKDGEVDILCSYKSSNRQFIIDVIDTGIGISTDVQNLLFMPFEQGDSSIGKKFGGTGLGLSIARQLANILRGELNLISSEEGKGSHFQLKVAENYTTNIYPQITSPNSSLKVLYVEDNMDNQLLMKENMREFENVELDVASSGIEALALCQKNTYNLILMDLQMPDMDGIQVSVKLHEMEIKTPIIAVTAYTLKYSELLTKKEGQDLFQSFLSKPLTKDLLKKAMELAS